MANDNVNHPAHYTSDEFSFRSCECIEIVRNLPFSIGNCIKYIWRAGNKGDVQKAIEDIEKAKWYYNDFFADGDLKCEEIKNTLSRVKMIVPRNRIGLMKLNAIKDALDINKCKDFMDRCKYLKEEFKKKK